MSGIVIQAEKLSKRYRIGQREPYKALRDSLSSAIYTPFRVAAARFKKNSSSGSSHILNPSLPGNQAGGETIWALDDVSFEIKQGQVVGIIGRNGAGKSTLLKVLSRITEPTRGVVDIWGRVGSLLEVGTGFHPELTGRENVYLNGAILGMHREEIARKFDEIVEFAEIEKFIDTPVKFYSTGMYLRLAFSVAAHLEPDILLIDEILAVGDAAFQKKCLGKMGDVAHQGRTVLFVSHQMNAIRELCPNCMWLDRGRLIDQGESARIVAKYLSHGLTKNEWTAQGEESTVDNPYFNPLRFCIVNQSLEPISHDIRADEDFGILIEGEAVKLNSALTVGFAIFAPSGELMFWSLHTDVAEQDWPAIEIGKNRLVAWIPPHLLNEGDYRIEMIVSLHFKEWIIQPGVNAPSIGLSIRGGLSQSPHWIMARPGTMAPVIKFERV